LEARTEAADNPAKPDPTTTTLGEVDVEWLMFLKQKHGQMA
jgi:hypothetical protein